MFACASDDAVGPPPPVTPGITAREWTSLGAPIGGNVSAVLSVGERRFAGTMGRGVWTENGGTWVQLANGPGAGPAGLVWALAGTPAGVILAGTQGGLYASHDFGATWSQRRNSAIYAAVATGDGVALAGTLFEGLARSMDGGATWLALPGPLDDEGILAIAHASGGTWYAGTTTGVYRSDDHGAQWTLVLTRGIINCLLVSQSGAVFAGSRVGGLFRSSDGGATWEPLGQAFAPLPDAFPDALAQDGESGRLYANVDMVLYASNDDGTTWQRTSSGIDRIRALAVLGNRDVMIGAEDGLWTSADGGVTRQQIGLEPLAVSVATAAAGTIAGASNGGASGSLYRRVDDAWVPAGFPDVHLNDVAVLNGTLFAALGSFEESGLGLLVASTDGGADWESVSVGPGEPTAVAAFGANGLLVGMLPFSGASGVRRSRDGGQTWEDASAGLPSEAGLVIHTIACASTCFALVQGGEQPVTAHRLDANTNRWSRIAPEQAGLRALAVAPDGLLYVATDRVVRRSANDGTSWSSGGAMLPSTPWSLAVDQGGTVYAGTESGLYASGDGGETWERVASPHLDGAVSAIDASPHGALTAVTAAGVVLGLPQSSQGRRIRRSN